jgi:hypothetical protein
VWRQVPAEPAGPAGVGSGKTKESVMETYDPHKTKTEVRQASPRKMNLRVLTFSLIGVVVAFVVIYLIFSLMQGAQ